MPGNCDVTSRNPVARRGPGVTKCYGLRCRPGVGCLWPSRHVRVPRWSTRQLRIFRQPSLAGRESHAASLVHQPPSVPRRLERRSCSRPARHGVVEPQRVRGAPPRWLPVHAGRRVRRSSPGRRGALDPVGGGSVRAGRQGRHAGAHEVLQLPARLQPDQSPDELVNDFRVLPYISQPNAPISTRASFVVENDVPDGVPA